MLLTILFLAIVLYGVIFTFLWGWSVYHALATPHEAWSRRGLWILALVVNPMTAMWYWYIWKRWAFWILFAPALVSMTFLGPVLQGAIRAFAARDVAQRFVDLGTLFLNNVVHTVPLPLLVPLVVFPFMLRLASLAHLGANSEMTAADRNDQAVAFGLPFFGFGGALAYCLKWRRVWALFGLLWFLLAAVTLWVHVRSLA